MSHYQPFSLYILTAQEDMKINALLDLLFQKYTSIHCVNVG